MKVSPGVQVAIGSKPALVLGRDSGVQGPKGGTLGFLRGLTRADPDADRIRAYLEGTPAAAREEWLMWATVCQIAELPVAAASRTGAAVTVTDLAPAVELVRRIMRQDRDLSAKLLRKAVVNLEAIFGGGMAGRDFGSNFEAGMAVMGLESPDGAGGVVFKGDAGAALGELDAQAARALADMVIVLMTLLVAAPEERPRQTGWSYYVDLHTGVPNRDVETDAYDFVSWIAILLGRLSNGGLLKGDVPFLASPWGYVPVLTQEGWYPVPNKTAKLVDGIAPLQRYWDGSQWTDRVRIRNSGHWQEGSLPIHAPPDE